MQNAFQLCRNENQWLGDNKKQNNMSSSHDLHVTTKQVISRRSLEQNDRTAVKCAKLKNARATHAKLLVFGVKYANLWRSRLPSRPGLLKLLVVISTWATIEIWKFPHQTVTHHGPELTFRRTSKPKGNYATDSRSSDLCLASNFWHLSPCLCPNAFSPFLSSFSFILK